MAYRQKVEAMYLDLAKKNKNWKVINCVDNGQILPKEVIHQKIIELLEKNLVFLDLC
jgi:thymidylate kinase